MNCSFLQFLVAILWVHDTILIYNPYIAIV